MNKKNKSIKIIMVIIVAIMIVLCGFYVKRINKYIYLTQFGPTTSRQMMGYAIKTINNKIIVIDGGTTGDATQLKEYLQKENNGIVDSWIITHPHSDHAGAFEILSQDNDIQINQIYMSLESKEWYLDNEPSRKEDTEEFFSAIENENIKNIIKQPKIGDILKIDNTKIEILGVSNPEIKTNAINNSSMVFTVNVNNKKILFLGDTGVESSEKLIKNQQNKLKADIVQIAHHGQNGATEELYNIIKPEICLWPTTDWLWNNSIDGVEDTGKWKTKETRNWMENLNVKQNYVAKDGTHSIKIF